MRIVIILLVAMVGAYLLAIGLYRPEAQVASGTGQGMTTQAATSGPAIGGAFTLTDHHGKTVTHKNFRGTYSLVFFGFTNCPDICPTTLYTITELMQRVDADGKRITPLFISVDEADTPDTLRDYLQNFHPAIVGLSGDAEQIKQVTSAYKVYYARVDLPESAAGYTMDHSSFLLLMSPRGEYVTHFSYQESLDKMAERITAELEKR